MASELIIERIKSNKNKDKAFVMGYIYTLNRVTDGLSYWVCEKRGTCKARIHTREDIITKPVLISEIEQAHTHTPSQDRIQMLKDYRKMKDIASNSEQSTRGILSLVIEEMHPSTVNKLPKLESVKRTIRNYKSVSKIVAVPLVRLKLSSLKSIKTLCRVNLFIVRFRVRESTKDRYIRKA